MQIKQTTTRTIGSRIHHHRSGLEAWAAAAFWASPPAPVKACVPESGTASTLFGDVTLLCVVVPFVLVATTAGGDGAGDGGGEGGDGGNGEGDGGGGGGAGSGDGGGGDCLDTSLRMPASL